MKKLSMLAVVISLVALCMSSVFAEEKAAETSEVKEKKYMFALQFQPLPITVFPVMGIYNFNVNAQFSAGIGNVGASAGYTYASVQNIAKAMGGTPSGSADAVLTVLDLEAFYRFTPMAHPVKGTLDGFYIGPGFRYEIVTGSMTGFGSATGTQFGLFADVGYQWVNNGFVADLNIGGGNYFNESATPYYFRFLFELGFAI